MKADPGSMSGVGLRDSRGCVLKSFNCEVIEWNLCLMGHFRPLLQIGPGLCLATSFLFLTAWLIHRK